MSSCPVTGMANDGDERVRGCPVMQKEKPTHGTRALPPPPPDLSCFPRSYSEARAMFKLATQRAGFRHEAVALGSSSSSSSNSSSSSSGGGGGDTACLDLAIGGTRDNPDTVLLITAGVDALESYAGVAGILQYLHSLPDIGHQPPPGQCVICVLTLNPEGMSRGTPVDRHGVWSSRSFVSRDRREKEEKETDFTHPPPHSLSMDEPPHSLLPWISLGSWWSSLQRFGTVLAHGNRALGLDSPGYRQHHNAKGIFYGGSTRDSTGNAASTLLSYLQQHGIGKACRLASVVLSTGARAPVRERVLSTPLPLGGPRYLVVNGAMGRQVECASGCKDRQLCQCKWSHSRGTLHYGLEKLLLGSHGDNTVAEWVYLTLHVGSATPLAMLTALRSEQQHRFCASLVGSPEPSTTAHDTTPGSNDQPLPACTRHTQAQLREHYCPEDKGWRAQFLEYCFETITRAEKLIFEDSSQSKNKDDVEEERIDMK